MAAKAVPGDRRGGDRRALAAVAVQFLVNGWAYAVFIPRLPEIQRRVDVSVGALGWILMAGTAASLLSSLFTGAVMSRYRARRVLVVAASTSTAALVVVGSAQHPAVLLAGLMTFAAADVYADVAMNMYGSALSARRRAPVMNRLHGLWSLGTVAGGVVTALAVRAGVGVPIYTAVSAAGLVVLLVFVIRGLPPDVDATPTEELPGDAGTTLGARRHWPVALALGLGGLAAISIEITGSDWAAFRLGRDLGAVDGVAVAGFVAFTSGMMFGRFGGDSVQVRLGRPRMTHLAGALALVGASLATLVHAQPAALAGLALLGLGTSVLFPQLYDAAAHAPGRRGAGFTAMLVGQRLGGTLVPITIASLANSDAFDFGAAMAVVLFPMVALVVLGGRAVVRLAPGPPTR